MNINSILYRPEYIYNDDNWGLEYYTGKQANPINTTFKTYLGKPAIKKLPERKDMRLTSKTNKQDCFTTGYNRVNFDKFLV